MGRNPNVVIKPSQTHGVVAVSGWEQLEARSLLHQLGWEWDAQHHAMVPPRGWTMEADAVYAIALLQHHGFVIADLTDVPLA